MNLPSHMYAAQIDTDALRREHATADLVASYGVELRRSGAALIGRCPFHNDGGRPNLHVYRSGRWICYRCGEAGDVIDFVQRVENISFREAVTVLQGSGHRSSAPVTRSTKRNSRPKRARLSVDERHVLGAAVELYASTLMNHPAALAYMAQRGFPPRVLEQYHIGFALGDELVSYLRWRRLPVPAAIRVGLLTRDGQEVMAGRITMPEFQEGAPVWLVGRVLERQDSVSEDRPRYLGLPGPKPLLGWSDVHHIARSVCVVEGPVDLLALRMWAVPGVGLAGGHASEQNLRLLECFDRLYLALDQDDAGRKATADFVSRFGPRAVPIALPLGVKDPAELARRVDGARLFRSALRAADDADRHAA